MKKNALLYNGLVMTLTSLFLRTSGIMYRVFVSEKIGAEGMGLHTLSLSVFTFAVTFATAGINTAVTRLVAQKMGSGESSSHVMRRAFTYALTVSMIALIIMFFSADFFSEHILSDLRAARILKFLAPALPLMAVSACIKGFFFAKRKASIPAFSDIVEQFTEMGIFALIVDKFAPLGTEYACIAIVLSTTVSEVFSCLYLGICYAKHRKSEIKRQENASVGLLRIAVPVALSASLNSGLRTVENILIPSGLRKFGSSNESALSLYGMVRGMAIPILFFPAAFLSAFSALMIPELSEALASRSQRRIRYLTARAIQFTLLLSILVTGVFLVFSNELGILIYESAEIGRIIQILAPLVVLMYADTIVDGMLKGLDLQVNVLWYNIVDSVIRIILIYFLIPRCGFWGFMAVMYVSNITNPVLSISKLLRVTKQKLDISTFVVKPIVAICASGVVVYCLSVVGGTFCMTPLGLTVGIALMCFVYFVLLLAFESLTQEDILWLYSLIRPKRSDTSCNLTKKVYNRDRTPQKEGKHRHVRKFDY